MREILFRGKTDKGEWVKGDLSQHKTGKKFIKCGSATSSFEVIPETVGQYTGMTANGKKIFEGDIVKATIRRCFGSNPQIREETGIIAYDSLGILGLKDNEDVWSDFMYELDLSGCIEDFYFEVIGNIHDNPELLKGE